MTEQVIATSQTVSVSEEQALLRRLREGEDAAFGDLFEQHAAAVRRLARGIASDSSEAEDITAETFFRVLQALRRGAGPRDHVRAYLLTVARRVCWEWHGARRDVPVTDDELTFRAGAGADSSARTPEHTLITSAFTSLPERWRTVLWQTEVEGEQPAVVAPHFGLSPNATAALARRARLGLRAAYLQAHLKVSRSSVACRGVVEKMGGYTAGSVTGAEARRIQSHLVGCQSCRSTHDELRDVCSSLRAHAGAIVFLVPAAGLSFGGMTGIGTASSTSAAVTAVSEGGAVAASGAAAGTSGGGVAAAAKGLFLGAKMKVGLAVASTAAVGALGISVVPVMVDDVQTQPMGLHGQGAPELHVAEVPAPAAGPPAVIGTEHTVGGAVAPVTGGEGHEPAGDVPQAPAGLEDVEHDEADTTSGQDRVEQGTPEAGDPAGDGEDAGEDSGGARDDIVPTPTGEPIPTPDIAPPSDTHVPGPDPDMAGNYPAPDTSGRNDIPAPEPTEEPLPDETTPVPSDNEPSLGPSSRNDTPEPSETSAEESASGYSQSSYSESRSYGGTYYYYYEETTTYADSGRTETYTESSSGESTYTATGDGEATHTETSR
ncbi:RNA polymerase subunit sigma [Amycolatopsis antarctica]|uniref:RNA polymerase subunit sigma n=1 Tax=Amycolatopsis antarctica TaxID=1854586 RepID=A0A263CVB4_9PSEU|nr:sigma-70 family RNA polymerase sigma factor [Amycolatopsis antarctica]OZM70054.1 RNA polymerase subunit sigma [Amycolatopsis antarctica]